MCQMLLSPTLRSPSETYQGQRPQAYPTISLLMEGFGVPTRGPLQEGALHAKDKHWSLFFVLGSVAVWFTI